MAGFVEQRDDVVVREHGGAVAVGAREVAGQVDHGRLHVAGDDAAGAFAVDPGAALLARAGGQGQVQIADQAAIRALDAHAARVAVPGGDGRFGQAHVEQFFDDVEQAGQHTRFGEVLLHFVFGIGIARFAQAFRSKGHVPGLQLVQAQFARGVGLELGQVALRKRFGAGGQVTQKDGDFAGVARHAGLQAQRGVGAQAQQAGFFGAQRQQLFDQGGIVELGIALFGCHGAVAAIQRFAQRAVLRVLHHGQVAGHFQGQLPARLAVFFGGGAGGGQHIGRDAGQARFIVHQQRPGVDGVQHVLGKLLRRLRFAVGDLRVAFAVGALQFHAAQAEVAQRHVDDAAAHGRPRCKVGRGGQTLVLLVQAFVQTDPG